MILVIQLNLEKVKYMIFLPVNIKMFLYKVIQKVFYIKKI